MKDGSHSVNIREIHSNSIDSLIINALRDADGPISTRKICQKINMSWHTVNSHCLKLQLAGKVKVLRAGNIALWSMNNGK